MKITDVECTMLRLPEVLPIADGTQDTLIVRIRTDEGLVGIGEAHTSPWVIKSVIEAPTSHYMARGLKQVVVGEDPRNIRYLWDKMYAFTGVFGRRGVVMHAISAIDIALWDLLGKITNQPVYRLLGGAYRHEITPYASILALGSAEASVKEAVKLVEQGYTAIKFGWNGLGADLSRDISVVREVRQAVGEEVALMLDVGAPIPLHKAIELAKKLEDFNVTFLEEPLSPDDFDGYASLTEVSSTPIAAGEKETTRFGFRDLIERGNLDIVQPDIARAGGLTECQRIADLASLRGVTVIPHCWSTDILVAATLHFIASLPECPYLEYCLIDNPIRREVTKEHIVPHNGQVAVPQKPGLGVELNEKTLEDLQYKTK